ncbi:hypothetical protein ACX80L_00345 [Arthrobacter sp. MDT1-48-3]
MRRFLRSSALLAATAVALSVAGASPASAITEGSPTARSTRMWG